MHPSDDDLSALVDGEAGDDIAAHVADCTQCSARLDALRAAATALGAPVSPPAPQVRDAAIARALASGTTGAELLSISTHTARAPRVAPRRRMTMLSAAAVLAVVLGVGGYALSQIGGTRTNTSSNNALKSTPPAGAENATAAADSSAAGGTQDTQTMMAAPAQTAYAAGDIGSFASIDAVAETARTQLSAPDASDHIATDVPPACALPEGSTLIWQATLTFQNAPAVALLRAVTNAQWVLEIRSPDASGCGLLASQDFAPTTPR